MSAAKTPPTGLPVHRASKWSKADFLRRHAEVYATGKPMRPPLVRVLLRHEQEQAA